MSVVYTYTEARQNLASLLDQAIQSGEVRVKRKDGQTFIIKPEQRAGSPLDIDGVDLDISLNEILQFIHESRRGLSFDNTQTVSGEEV